MSSKRFGLEHYADSRQHTRSDFQRDYDRMVFSSPFRRLQNKTQVFPLPGSIFVHNRLTHSLEVSSVGRSLANEAVDLLRPRYKDSRVMPLLEQTPDIVATACLCHDLGNPPFGHSGEKTIASWFSEGPGLALADSFTSQQWADFVNFEGNANSFRLLTNTFNGRRPGGFAMTYSVLASIVKYPYSSLHAGGKGKFGFFSSEQESYRRVADELGILPHPTEEGRFCRHPLVYIMEAADDICYQIMDIEDAHKLKIVSSREVSDLFLSYFERNEQQHMKQVIEMVDDPNERVAYLRSHVIGALVRACARIFADHEEEMLYGRFEGSLIDHLPEPLKWGYIGCSDLAWERIYRAQDVVDVELAGNRIISSLMDHLVDAVINPKKNASQLLLLKVPRQYDTMSPSLYGRVQSVLDHVSAMTDVYALDLFRKLNAHSLPAV